MLKFNDYLKEAALSAKQKKIAAVAGDKDKIDAADLAALRTGKKPVDEASCSSKDMKKEELVGKQHKLDKNKNGKLDAHDFKLLRKEEAEQIDELSKNTLGNYVKGASKDMMDRDARINNAFNKDPAGSEKGLDKAFNKQSKRSAGFNKAVDKLTKEEVELDEGRVKELSMDLKDMSHDEFHKRYGKPKSHFDSTNFKKPVEPGKGMDRAKALAQRGMQSLSKEEVERIEEKLTQIDELSKDTLASYVGKAAKNVKTKTLLRKDFEYNANSKSSKNPEIDRKIAGEFKDEAEKRLGNINKAAAKMAKEEKDYVSATLKVMDEGKIDNLRDAQKLRQDTQSAYDKNYKPDTSHPHIQVVKGNAYGGANQKDDEGDEKPDETKEKKGRGRPTGSKSGARQKGGGHEDGGIPVHNLNLPKSYK